MPATCSAFGCKNRFQPGGKVQFFGFPLKNEHLFKSWVINIRRKDFTPTKASKICSDHFKENDYLVRPGTYVRKLKPDAVPTIFPAFPSHLKQKEYSRRVLKKISSSQCYSEQRMKINQQTQCASGSSSTPNEEVVTMPTKYCLITNCFNRTNGSKVTQKKIFIRVPQNEEDRKRWFKAIFGHEDYSSTVNLFVCEDHFNLREDVENFEEFKLIGTRLRLKKGVVPHIGIHNAIEEHLPSHISSSSKKKIANIRSLHSKKKFALVNTEKSTSTQTTPDVEFPSGVLHVESTKHLVHLVGNEEIKPFVQQEMHQFGENSLVNEDQEALMDTQLHSISAYIKEENKTTNQNFEEIYIKDEPLEEISQEYESYENVLQSLKKEEDVTDDDDVETEVTNSNYFCCEVCDQIFEEEQSLQVHLKIHEGITKYECSTCKKIFTRKDSLKLHMRIHDGVKEFECPTCNKSFTQNCQLKRHLLSHNGIKNYKCNICEKLFTRSDTLSSHMTVHDGIKKYQCSICHKKYSLKNSLIRHMYIHI